MKHAARLTKTLLTMLALAAALGPWHVVRVSQ